MPDENTPDLPPDNGRRAGVAPDGSVLGSGVGAGGGQEGEDFDSDAATGSDYPQTGGEGTDHAPGSRGPRGAA